jgi:hypothetical protein
MGRSAFGSESHDRARRVSRSSGVRDNPTGLGSRAMAAPRERGNQPAPITADLRIKFKLAPLRATEDRVRPKLLMSALIALLVEVPAPKGAAPRESSRADIAFLASNHVGS